MMMGTRMCYTQSIEKMEDQVNQRNECSFCFGLIITSKCYSHINVGVENWYHSAGIVNGDPVQKFG